MYKNKIIPQKRIKTINIDEIEIKTYRVKKAISSISLYISILIVLLCESYYVYLTKKIEGYVIFTIFVFLLSIILDLIFSNWNLKITNSKLYIKYALKKYIIDINNLVSIELKHRRIGLYRGRRTIYYLNIIYEENKMLKEINLTYKSNSVFLVNKDKINQLMEAIQYEYYEPILDGDSLNINSKINEVFIVAMAITIGWTLINITLYIMTKVLGE